MQILADRLKQLRNEKKISQRAIAVDLDMAFVTWQRYEYGKMIPGADILLRIADYFDVSTDYLLGRTDNRQSHK